MPSGLPEESRLFEKRHIGVNNSQAAKMLSELGFSTIENLIKDVVPGDLLEEQPAIVCDPEQEHLAMAELKEIFQENLIYQNHIGLGYYPCITPAVIKRNILENPSWYTQYTPYQAEIAQGRLEALFNFQTMLTELTGLPIANASLLDEATAASEALAMVLSNVKTSAPQVLISENIHPQTKQVIKTRLSSIGATLQFHNPQSSDNFSDFAAVIMQYPDSEGCVLADYPKIISQARQHNCYTVLITDLMSLILLKSPGQLGAHVAVGSSQRFGVPLGFGGPHAAFITAEQSFLRKIPGRMVGLSKDSQGNKAYRLALQTREQHIRREKATSNICTAQVLLAIMASMYCVYHGPKELHRIAKRIHFLTKKLAATLSALGFIPEHTSFFDTLLIAVDEKTRKSVLQRANDSKINLRKDIIGKIGISLDETTTQNHITKLVALFSPAIEKKPENLEINLEAFSLAESFLRTDRFLTQKVFNDHHSETQLLRYIKRLETRDLSLTHSMIPLGSCTMKLNAASELYPITWPEISLLHPFAPESQTRGYRKMIDQLETWIATLTGFHGVSFQPNSGAQGEYAGLMVINQYHNSINQEQRNVCLIPSSAHGTNPASAAMAGMKIVVIKCNDQGNIDIVDLQAKADLYKENLGVLMITYPSTHGVFEEGIREICGLIHDRGGQVYLDGANLNAQIGLCLPGKYGPDICHLNLHKTFCIPHGGGGPGMGPIAAKKHLTPFFPGHPLVQLGTPKAIGPIAAAPWGSPSILPISWMYIRMMGHEGLKKASEIAILNANYIAKKLDPHFSVVYKGSKGLVAHECIIDLQPSLKTSKISVEDVAKRLIDYGFHAPTVSWPVPNSMMIEPTESEDLEEIDRFCDAMIAIKREINKVSSGEWDMQDNPLKSAPHTALMLASEWPFNYSRQVAAYPNQWAKEAKFWPYVSRIDNTFGDRNLVCACPPIQDYMETPEV